MPAIVNHAHIFHLSPTPTIILLPDYPDFTIADINAAYLKIASIDPSELIGKPFIKALQNSPYQNFPEGNEQLQKVLETKKTQESPVREYKFPSEKGGYNTRYFHISNVPALNSDGEVELIIRSATDITETVVSRQKEERIKTTLLETNLLMEQGQEMANFGNWRWDVVENKVSWSETLYHIYGLDKNSFKATFEGYQELLHPDDRELVFKSITGALQNKQDVMFEERIIRPNGEIRYLKSWGKVQTDDAGNPITMIGACLDITDTKIAETTLKFMHGELEQHMQTLAASEKKYSDLFHLSPLPMWVLDVDTFRFLDVNDAALTNYGYSRDEFLAMSATSLLLPEDIKSVTARVRSNSDNYNIITRHVKKNGELIKVSIQSKLLPPGGKPARIVLANDITERQNYVAEIEKQNQQLQEIAWIQSHVVRVPLARIMGLLELYRIYQDSEIDRQELINIITLSANELDDIIKGLCTKIEEVSNHKIKK
ncbi:PAS domain S-box protein [Mucilaginibacter sp. KACC 22063]|uniref:PAS domain S-box protein n=1 Tax=Mucilaginibacter sp. KACC 22063 TaxID=3025666 RepID=UPI0023671ADA|nr:PAS domain S-box protein [Mucilaginibacter sp. KACC 22063]WDF53822.1 PAS domain S-box protein [Mucilaginibacter sp. KACC 22063]